MSDMNVTNPRVIISRAFDQLQDFFLQHGQYSGVSPENIEGIRSAFANERALDEKGQRDWQSVVYVVDDFRQRGTEFESNSAARIYEIFRKNIGPLTESLPSILPWHLYDKPERNVTLFAYDEFGTPLPIVRALRFSRHPAKINLDYVDGVINKDTHVTYLENGYYWTVLAKRDGRKNNKEDNKTVWLSSEHDALSKSSYNVPLAYWKNESIQKLLPIERDTTVLLRSILEEAGLYKSRATMAQDIQIFVGGSLTPVASFEGFGVKELSKDTWIELNHIVSKVDGKGLPVVLRSDISKELAAKILSNLRSASHILRRMGVAMRSWLGTQINLKSGEVSLGEGDSPVLIMESRFRKAVSKLPEFLNSAHESVPLVHLPSIVLSASGDSELQNSDLELSAALAALQVRSGKKKYPKEEALWELVEAFNFFVEYIRNPSIHEALQDTNNKATVSNIISRYLDVFHTSGARSFVSGILPLILASFDDREAWLEVATQLIDEANELGPNDVNAYWQDKASELLEINEEIDRLITDDDEGGNSAPASFPPIGGMFVGSGGAPIPQAKGFLTNAPYSSFTMNGAVSLFNSQPPLAPSNGLFTFNIMPIRTTFIR